ncbi:hypothetical protein DFH09DRAFT_1404881 [Mycena vulgaris]|nr:hypothetical protein DFH09DRAFT_1404881 [Mycena vulgaris]
MRIAPARAAARLVVVRPRAPRELLPYWHCISSGSSLCSIARLRTDPSRGPVQSSAHRRSPAPTAHGPARDSQPADSQRMHRGLAPQRRQLLRRVRAAATLRARPVRSGAAFARDVDLWSSRAAIPFWRRHRIRARSRTLLVRPSAACALRLRCYIGRHGDLARSQRRVDLTARGASTGSCLPRFASVSARFSAALDTAQQGGDGDTACRYEEVECQDECCKYE